MKNIISIFLAMLILASNSGAIIATHYCMGEVADVNIGFKTHAHKCNMANMDTECEYESKHPGTQVNPVNCCDDDYIQMQLDEPFDAPLSSEISPQFLVAFTTTFNNLYNFQPQPKVGFVDYSPPLLEQNIPVLFQTFLI